MTNADRPVETLAIMMTDVEGSNRAAHGKRGDAVGDEILRDARPDPP